MKIVIAPDKFKDSLTGFEFCDAVAEGLQHVFDDVEIVKMPLADGGDGTIDVVRHYIHGEKISITVNDPLFRPISASYLYASENRIAYIEMAEASGLKLLADADRNCMNTTTFGTGELIADALERGAQEIILGIGGSATNDGGMGMANALGYRFKDSFSKELNPVGSNLNKVKSIDASKVHPLLANAKFKIACDVSNPFYGVNGAAKIYAAQKGASEEEIALLDNGLKSFAKVVFDTYNISLQKIQGSGAAGGIGGGAIVFLRGELTSGIDLVKGLARFDEVIANADWVITGEGQLDEQTLSGKTIDGVITSAKKANVPVAALCGSVSISIEQQEGFGLAYVNSIVRGVSTLPEAMASSYTNLVNASYNFAKLIK
ncbi:MULTISPECIES: glycerate kinase [Zobellia]|uniref:glycerate kinase n=1 Tax=Zobellia TaxID=112040 RepID=UPI000B532B32|nr:MULTISPECIES: glycerate kinase [Zobellia]MBU3026169.1 glycerate kinase [Zobellia galactanivorans]OWW27249.1 glycerate kinase [Zobellia sp. OII3]